MDYINAHNLTEKQAYLHTFTHSEPYIKLNFRCQTKAAEFFRAMLDAIEKKEDFSTQLEMLYNYLIPLMDADIITATDLVEVIKLTQGIRTKFANLLPKEEE